MRTTYVLSVLQSQDMLFHGPDTVQRFGEFSMGGLIDELKSSCPELYRLMQELGRTQRNAVADSIPNKELKTVMAIYTLLNARSQRVKGLQLMMSLMLVARGIGRQVYNNIT